MARFFRLTVYRRHKFTDGWVERSGGIADSVVAFLDSSSLHSSTRHPPRRRIDITDTFLSIVAGIRVQDHSNTPGPLPQSHLQYDLCAVLSRVGVIPTRQILIDINTYDVTEQPCS